MAKLDVDAKIREWVLNPRVYAQDLLKIQTEDGFLKPFILTDVQNLFYDVLEDIKRQGRPIRVVVLKARRVRISTATAARFFHRIATRKNTYAMMVTHEPQATNYLFSMHKRFYENLPAGLKPQKRFDNSTILAFNAPNGKGMDSAIRVATAGSDNIGSSQMIHLLHLSELPKWPKHTTTNILNSVLQCVPKGSLDTEVIIESSPFGMGNEFHQRFKDCRYRYEFYMGEDRKPHFRQTVNEDIPPENEWTSIFIPFFCFSEYSRQAEAGFSLTEQEKELKDLYGLTTHQLVFRRYTIENECGRNEDTFKQEYPINSEDCFLGTGDTVFNLNNLMKLKAACKPPKARYEVMLSTSQFISKPEGEFRVWKEPDPTSTYIVSADVAEGLRKGDFSSADVIDQMTGEQVAHWHGHIAPDLFGLVLAAIGKRYNIAWIVPEKNKEGGTTVLKLYDIGYPKLYLEKVPDPPNKPRKRYGFVTSRQTKPMVVANLVAEEREGTLGINCSETLDEMMTFVKEEDGEYKGSGDSHDDRVMSFGIGKFVRTRLPLPNHQRQRNTGWEQAPAKRETPNIKAWL